MARKSRKDVRKLFKDRNITPKSKRNVYEALEQIMDELRNLDGRKLANKITKVVRKVDPLREVVKASLKAIKPIDPLSGFTSKNRFTNSKELNELMKDSLKRRDWSKMDQNKINKELRELDDKLDLPIELDNPPTKIFKDKDNNIYHQLEVQDSLGKRVGAEKQFLESATPYGVETVEGMERAHSLGPGLGVDSPFGLFFAAREVNGKLQNQGIEAFIGILHETLKKQGKKVRLTTRAQPHFGTHRLKEIAYKIEIVDEKGKAKELFQYGISIASDNSGLSHGLIGKKNSSLLDSLKLKDRMGDLDTKNKAWRTSALSFLDTVLSKSG